MEIYDCPTSSDSVGSGMKIIFKTHVAIKTTDYGACGKLFGLNMCDPLIDIHEQFEYLNQWNGYIVAYHIVLYDIPMLQQYHLCRRNGTHTVGALSNQNAALLVLPSFTNPHDMNWMKLEFLMAKIIIFAH